MTQPNVVTLRVPGSEVQVGDDLIFLSAPHRITRIEPYTHPVVTKGETWAIAYADTPQRSYRAAWGMTLCPGASYEIVRVQLQGES